MINQTNEEIEISTQNNCNYYDIETIRDSDDIINSKYNLVHLNIRSYKKNLDLFLSSLDYTNVKFPIIMLSETWLKNEEEWLNIPNYTAFHSLRKNGNKQGYGGVCILLHDKLKGELIPSLTVNNEAIESVAIKTEINKRTVNLVCLYRPPENSTTLLETFNETLSGFLNNLPRREANFLGGDLNIDLNSSNLSNAARDLQELLASEFYLPLINLPTRVTATSSTCIDHLYTNTLFPIESGILDCGITDHRAIFCTIPNTSTYSNEIFDLEFRDHSTVNIESLRQELINRLSNFERYKDFSIDSKILIFQKILFSCYENNCPIKTKQVSYRNLTSPWISASIKRSIRHKNALYELCTKNTNNTRYFNQYNSYKNVLGKVIKAAKDSYYLSKFTASAGDIKKTWKSINSIIRTKSKAPDLKIDLNGDLISDSSQISECFNEFFASVAPKLASSIPQTSTDPLSFVHRNPNTFIFFDSTEYEVENVINKLKNKKKGINEVPISIYKKTADIISKIICKILNESISKGIFPSPLKIARIIPIHKSGSKQKTNNYRPISILPTISKIFEKIMHMKMMKFINKFNLLYTDQFGFRNQKSTTDAILKFTNECYEALNESKSMISIYLDFSKAFDTINHSLLCSKLECFGFRGNINKWFQSYLSNRKQYVCVKKSQSSLRDTKFGVPQGSILGPLLFLIYINDMRNCTQLSLIHFADDSTAFMSFNNPEAMSVKVNSELTKIDDWVCANQLSLNAAKTTFSIIAPKKINPDPIIKIRNTNIERTQCQKFLGVLLDENLNFQSHINSICLKISRATGIIRKMKDLVPPNILTKLYYALVYPHVIYAIEVWGKSSKTALKRLSNKLKKAHELLPMSESPKLMNLDQIYSLFCLIKFFKYHQMKESSYFHIKFNNSQVSHNINTRQNANNLFRNPYIHSSKMFRSFYYFAITKWNALPSTLRCIKKTGPFKKQIKKYLRAN